MQSCQYQCTAQRVALPVWAERRDSRYLSLATARASGAQLPARHRCNPVILHQSTKKIHHQAIHRPVEITGVQTGQLRYRLIEPGKAPDQQQPGQTAATDTVQCPHIEEGPAHVTVGTADELDHLDLGAAVFDMQADGITDHQQQRGNQNQGQGEDETLAQPQHGGQPLDPLQVQSVPAARGACFPGCGPAPAAVPDPPAPG